MAYPSFYADELQAALREQGSSIKTFSFLRWTDEEAEASITLLEEQVVRVVLTERGYVEKSNNPNAPTRRSDTLDGLLKALSPMYEQEQHRKLMSALEKLAEERNQETD
ncbi:hypothetical protein PM082_017286 [Marasmius tenuissimus]|nr:hypothetical protein PM082_017286 [Marasmius tenuissimus]